MSFLVPHTNETSYPSPPLAERQGDGAVSPMLIFSVIRRRKYSILLVAIVLSTLVVGAATRLKPGFGAAASVLMQERKTSVTDVPTATGSIATDSVAIRTQTDILRSADLARRVVRTLHLVDEPEFSPHTGLLAFLLERLHAIDKPGLLDRLGISPTPPTPLTLEAREELATEILLGMTTIVNDARSYVIDIKVKVTAPSTAGAARAAKLSADLANAFADAYVELTGRMKSDSIRHANGFFDERINTLKEKMRLAERAVQTYRVENGLVEDRAASTDGRSVTLVGQQMTQLNTDLIAAASDRAKKEASLEQINLARSGGGDIEAVPEVVASPLIQRLREQQAELGSREAGLAMSRGAGSPDLIAVRASQRDVANKIAAETAKIAASLRSGVAAARARETALRASLGQLQTQVGVQGQAEIKLHELQNEADIARVLYTSYLKRSEETANQIDMQDPDALVLSRAGIPLAASPPSKQQVIVVGVVLSFVLSVMFALVRERLQSGFRTSEELEASVGVMTLGFVPKIRNLRQALRFEDRRSAFSEAIFSIRALLRLSARRGSQVIMVTSAMPQEGKTFFSSSLARNAALAGERVLLIDCDLRRPAVARNIIATEARELENVTIRRDILSSLDIITLTSGLRSPQDLFASTHMRNLIGMLREHYDLIVLDTPPVLAVTDARVLSGLADVTLLVVCWRKTSQKLVNSAVSALRGNGANIAGTVINRVKMRDLDETDGASAYTYGNSGRYLPAGI